MFSIFLCVCIFRWTQINIDLIHSVLRVKNLLNQECLALRTKQRSFFTCVFYSLFLFLFFFFRLIIIKQLCRQHFFVPKKKKEEKKKRNFHKTTDFYIILFMIICCCQFLWTSVDWTAKTTASKTIRIFFFCLFYGKSIIGKKKCNKQKKTRK